MDATIPNISHHTGSIRHEERTLIRSKRKRAQRQARRRRIRLRKQEEANALNSQGQCQDQYSLQYPNYYQVSQDVSKTPSYVVNNYWLLHRNGFNDGKFFYYR